MIFKAQMKDPDILYDAINEALDKELADSGLDVDEQEAVRELRLEKAQKVADKWFTYGEYLTVEIDTDKETIKVVEKNV